MTDFKDLGKPSSMPPMLVDLCFALVVLVVLLTVYSLVADEPSRQIVVTTKASMQREIQQERIKAALEAMTNMYVALVNSGDAGNWNPETDEEIIQARAAIAKARGE